MLKRYLLLRLDGQERSDTDRLADENPDERGGMAERHAQSERCELRRASFAACRIARVDLIGCALEELIGVESLRGARMPWGDILENAPLFAVGLGIQVLPDE